MSSGPTAARASVALKEAGLAAIAAFALALPMIGFRTIDSENGLTIETRFGWVAVAVATVFAGRLALGLWPPEWKWRQRREPRHTDAKTTRAPAKFAAYAIVSLAILLPFLPFADRYIIDLATTVLIYVMLGWGLNIVVGLAGLLDLGYVAFYAVGAYSFALLARNFSLDFWECLPLAGAFSATFGILLGFPVLRLRGDYLAIVTLGFGEMVRIVLINWGSFTGGPNGLTSIPRPTFFGMPFAREAEAGGTTFSDFFGLAYSPLHRLIFLYFIVLGLALLTNAFTLRIRRLPVGRAWEALREDEIAAKALGINPTNTKLTAFSIGAMFGGFAGSFFATRQGFISPESFTFIESALILAIVVLGGMGSQTGVVVAATLLVVLPEFGRQFAEFRMLLFGAAMIGIMVWRPHGLLARRDPSIRLHGYAGAKRGQGP
ncbi:MAG TPA: high-affinity branched-chain amino acid ABC transporter permease LivM [Alphaproteobacteria bacterium]|nr:high-affinity branched-chain amino acid ABC transporter permease LivM [Alphaproteobacteria bacterium]